MSQNTNLMYQNLRGIANQSTGICTVVQTVVFGFTLGSSAYWKAYHVFTYCWWWPCLTKLKELCWKRGADSTERSASFFKMLVSYKDAIIAKGKGMNSYCLGHKKNIRFQRNILQKWPWEIVLTQKPTNTSWDCKWTQLCPKVRLEQHEWIHKENSGFENYIS